MISDPYGVVCEEENECIMKQLLEALAFVHSKDLIHRDVKVRHTTNIHCDIVHCDIVHCDIVHCDIVQQT